MSQRRMDMMPLWTDAYMADTTHLGLEHHGAYLLLLQKAWRMGTADLPDDDMFLRNTLSITQKKWKQIRPVLEPFFTIENGRWTHKRLAKEWAKAKRLASPKETPKPKNGLPEGQGMDAKKSNENNDGQNPYTRAEAGAGAGAVEESVPPPEISNDPSSSSERRKGDDDDRDFDNFWEAFPHAGPSSQTKAKSEWQKLAPDDRAAALTAITDLAAAPRGVFAWTWLTERHWRFGGKTKTADPPERGRGRSPDEEAVRKACAERNWQNWHTAWLDHPSVSIADGVVQCPARFIRDKLENDHTARTRLAALGLTLAKQEAAA